MLDVAEESDDGPSRRMSGVGFASSRGTWPTSGWVADSGSSSRRSGCSWPCPTRRAQRAALATIGATCGRAGSLVLDLFDPRLDLLAEPSRSLREIDEGRHPLTGRLVRVTAVERANDPVHQRFSERWRFREIDDDGSIVREESETLVLRWTYRHELHHLLELAGFEPIAEYSDYAGSPPAYGNEIIVVARRPGGNR